jgi:hypothetical protein
MGKLIFQITCPFAEFERSMILIRRPAIGTFARATEKVVGQATRQPTGQCRPVVWRPFSAHGGKQ